ncbi:uncharacterized protein MONBRDRAFT_35608 [Monosiga brevicollis MX1]|uniref:Uncharacterized protein n=1 Tax=Monosiga brevicollis TaxID=81824 RepID=A9UQ93_MONBE|nr:uncharacterized protein MONBRDRAFT_35608 [Monosiga brevicollis MX1]EDQ93008.1 predicted protein [Monosiga brevicollis MX1]|eukprot:XP_001742770.1 hypothetical protein [Monosiga brevicollis MX1]
MAHHQSAAAMAASTSVDDLPEPTFALVHPKARSAVQLDSSSEQSQLKAALAPNKVLPAPEARRHVLPSTRRSSSGLLLVASPSSPEATRSTACESVTTSPLLHRREAKNLQLHLPHHSHAQPNLRKGGSLDQVVRSAAASPRPDVKMSLMARRRAASLSIDLPENQPVKNAEDLREEHWDQGSLDHLFDLAAKTGHEEAALRLDPNATPSPTSSHYSTSDLFSPDMSPILPTPSSVIAHTHAFRYGSDTTSERGSLSSEGSRPSLDQALGIKYLPSPLGHEAHAFGEDSVTDYFAELELSSDARRAVRLE